MSAEADWWPAITTYFGFAVLIAFGYVRDFFYKLFKGSDTPDGYAPITSDFDDFFKRRLYYRARDNFNRPITGCPGAEIDVLERVTHDYNHTFE
jgi:serine palmitoyltransferase